MRDITPANRLGTQPERRSRIRYSTVKAITTAAFTNVREAKGCGAHIIWPGHRSTLLSQAGLAQVRGTYLGCAKVRMRERERERETEREIEREREREQWIFKRMTKGK